MTEIFTYGEAIELARRRAENIYSGAHLKYRRRKIFL